MKCRITTPTNDISIVKLELDPLLILEAVEYHPFCGVFQQISLEYATGIASMVEFSLLSAPPVLASYRPKQWTKLEKGQILHLDAVAVTGIVAWCGLDEWGVLEISTERWRDLTAKPENKP